MGFFSIVIPLFNKENTILRTIRSIVNQTMKDFEVLIIDDGSTDNSLRIVESVVDERFQIIRQPNSGQSVAKNRGVQHANNDWVIFLDADDTFLPNALELFYEMIIEHPGCDCYCGNLYIEKNGQRVLYSEKMRLGIVKNNFFSYYFYRCVPHTGCAAYRRNTLSSKPFNEFHRRAEDAEMVFNFFRKHTVFSFPNPVMEYNRDYSQVSHSNKDWEHDFQFHIDLSKKSFWEKMCLYELYIDAKDRYKITGKSLYKDYDRRYILLFAEKVFRNRW